MPNQKHTKLKRPQSGRFCRNEWSIIGTPCGNLKKIAYALIEQLSEVYKVSYLDADHKEKEVNPDSAMAYKASKEITNQINQYRIEQKESPNTFQFRSLFNDQDLVLVNGNHFKAQQQIVVIDTKKAESLERKLDRLTDVQLLLIEGDSPIPDYLKGHLQIDDIPVLATTETDKIVPFLLNKMKARTPVLKGLVLAGGKSVRMGLDKGGIDYHGTPQRKFLTSLLKEFCTDVFLSCRSDQEVQFKDDFQTLPDKMVDLGPFGAILTAFQSDPDAAWLVVACDLPMLDKAALDELIGQRDRSAFATAFHNPETGFPDPLITIWEPRSYPILLQFLAMGYSCPRKVLINSSIHEIKASNPMILTNVNTKEELDEMKLRLGSIK